ncbi:MAG: hypothetical protein LBC20_12230, partial [Planctomycetaceae bacterium]|jgi:hypothetical protein|nr:hypothetical protein [Planctomycetaceae bacterium]
VILPSQAVIFQGESIKYDRNHCNISVEFLFETPKKVGNVSPKHCVGDSRLAPVYGRKWENRLNRCDRGFIVLFKTFRRKVAYLLAIIVNCYNMISSIVNSVRLEEYPPEKSAN